MAQRTARSTPRRCPSARSLSGESTRFRFARVSPLAPRSRRRSRGRAVGARPKGDTGDPACRAAPGSEPANPTFDCARSRAGNRASERGLPACPDALPTKTRCRSASLCGEYATAPNETKEILAMRSIFRTTLVALLAVFALGAVASASASAATCTDTEEPKTIPMYCIAGADGDSGFPTTEATGETISSKGGTFILEFQGGPYIECRKEVNTAVVWNSPDSTAPGGQSAKLKITFTECTVKANPRCTVEDTVKRTAGTIEVGGLKDGLKAVGTTIYDVIKPATGTAFVTLQIQGTGCLFSGTFELRGEICGEASTTLLVQAPLTFSKAVEEACKATEKLKLGAKSAFLKGVSEQELTGVKKGKEWAAVLT
jgi:hypothetical protein